MELIDVSMVLSNDTLVYPGDPKVETKRTKSLVRDGVNLSKISMGLHSGTHIDAPAHYLKGGKTIDEINLQSLIGKARVCDLTKVSGTITETELRKCGIRKDEIILFKTRNSNLSTKKFSKTYICLSPDGADYLIKRKIKAVGIDYLSIEAAGSCIVHKKLLTKNTLIIEGLVLKNVKPGIYQMVCLPLKIRGGEAAPARCTLFK
jgi:arylformamidase